MAHLGIVGTAVASTSQDTVAITLTDDVPVDATVLVGIAWDSPSPGSVPTISSVTDTGGNSWTTTPDASVNAGVTVAVAVLRARITTPLEQGDTISVTIDDARGRWCMQADAFDDLVETPLDETSTSDGASSSLTTGQTSETSVPHTLLYAVFGFGGGRDVTIPQGWDGDSKLETAAGSGNRALQVIYRYVTEADEYEATLGLSSSSTYAAALAAYEYTAPEPADPVAQVSQLAFEVPQPGDALLAQVSQLAFEVPAGVQGSVQVSQLAFEVPAAPGQKQYTGVKAKVDGLLWDVEVWAAGP